MGWPRLIYATRVPQTKEPWPIPAGTGDRDSNRGEAIVGRAVPGKAIRHRHDAVLAALPFAHQDGTSLSRGLLAVEGLELLYDLASRFGLGILLKSTLRCDIEIAKRISLQSMGEDTKQDV